MAKIFTAKLLQSPSKRSTKGSSGHPMVRKSSDLNVLMNKVLIEKRIAIGKSISL